MELLATSLQNAGHPESARLRSDSTNTLNRNSHFGLVTRIFHPRALSFPLPRPRIRFVNEVTKFSPIA
jgi:hypothetical protein